MTDGLIISFLLLFLLGCCIAVVLSVNALYHTLRQGLPFVSTPTWAITWLHDSLELTAHDVVYELGCGRAIVIASLAKKFPHTTFIGIEIQWWPFILAKIRTHRYSNVRIIRGNIFRHDLSSATLVYGFFISGFMARLAEKLRHDLKPNTQIISFGFPLPNWTQQQEISNPKTSRGSKIRIYLR